MLGVKIFHLIGILNVYQLANAIENSAQSPLGHLSKLQIENSTQQSPIVTNSLGDEWTSFSSLPSTNSITRLLPVNTTTIKEDDVTTIFEITCSSDDNINDYKIETFHGDIMVSIVLHQSDNAANVIKFIVERINEISLLAHNISLGARILYDVKSENVSEIIENELDYLEHCMENPFGLFLSMKLWHHVSLNDKNHELKIWPIHDMDERQRMKFLAHLLNELPLTIDMKNISVELKTDSMNRTKIFQSIIENEGICFKNFPSDHNLFVYIGGEEFFKSVSFATNQSLVIVPFQNQDISIDEIPQGSFIIQEDKIGNLTYPSTFISIAATFLEISNTINNAISKLYHTSNTTRLNLTKCEICSDLEVFGDPSFQNPKRILDTLKLNSFKAQMNYVLYQKSSMNDLKKLATTNYVTNDTAVFIRDRNERMNLGTLFKCAIKEKRIETSFPNVNAHNGSHHPDAFNINEIYPPTNMDTDINVDDDFVEMYWELRSELWVAIGLTMSTLGILLSMAILTFIIIRICMDDVLEGNPIGSIVMLIVLIAQFTSFFPFTIEYESSDLSENHDVMNSMCIIKLFLVSVSYCLTFSLLLSRAIMLASIGSEGGFLSHVNGYIQSIICFFSFIVQLGLSIQLLIVMNASNKNITCLNIYHGNWFWAVISYDGFILLMLVSLSPFIFKSQRNYNEGVLIVITSILCVICWAIWIPLSMIDDYFREIMISLGVQTTAWIILGTLMVPRCFLIVKSIARTDFTQALPSLTSLAFAQANQFISEPSIYECVNPTMRTRSIGEESDQTSIPNEPYQSPNDVPTLPLRSGRRNFADHYNLHFNEIVNPNLPSPNNKMTRF